MLRIRSVAIGLSIAFALVAMAGCRGDKGGGSSDGQPDYLERALAAISDCTGGNATATPNLDGVVRELESQAEQLARLTPPEDLREQQSNLVRALHAVRASYASQSVTIQADSEFVQTFNAAVSAEKSWQDGLSAHYGAQFYKNLGQSMEPAFNDGDHLAVHAVNGPIEQWQLLVFKFPLDPARDFIKRVVG